VETRHAAFLREKARRGRRASNLKICVAGETPALRDRACGAPPGEDARRYESEFI
jgi:hypothetical protein